MADLAKVTVTWIDRHQQPRGLPDPKYPNGRVLNMAIGARKTCSVELDHPTKGCGYYLLVCERCHLRVVVTTAGRVDDPRKVKLACKVH